MAAISAFSGDDLSRSSTLLHHKSDSFLELEEAIVDADNDEEKMVATEKKITKIGLSKSVRVLEPARKKLSTLETQRIASVIESAIRNSDIITGIPSILNRLDDVSTVFTRNLVTLVQSYRSVKERYDELSARLDAVRGIRQNRVQEIQELQKEETLASEDFWTSKKTNTNQSGALEQYGVKDYSYSAEEVEKFRENQENITVEMNEVSKHVIHLTRCLLLGFKSNPAATKALTSTDKEWKVKRGPGDSNFSQTLKKLKDVMTLKMRSNPLEEEEKNSYLRKVNEKHMGNLVQVRELENQLDACIKKKNDQISMKNEIIRKLQMDIHMENKRTEEKKKKIRSEMDRQQDNDQKNNDSVCQKLQIEKSQKESTFKQKRKADRTAEKEMRNQKRKEELELEDKLMKYDTDMSAKQAKFEEEENEFNQLKANLDIEEEKYKILEEEVTEIKKVQKIAEEKREAERREEETLIRAVLTIQSFWRSYKVRKGVRGKKKGKGKGKKKK